MPTAQWRHRTGLIQQLLDEPYRFGFFQAVRVLEHYFAQHNGGARNAVANHVRFKNTLSLAFPASELMAAEPHHDPQQTQDEASAPNLSAVDLTPAFFGLLGANGALPLQYTERLSQRETYHRDRAARAFLDIFTTRSAALFYAAWKKYRLGLQYEIDRRSRALPVMRALAGVNYPGLRRQLNTSPGAIEQESLAFHAGTLWRRPTSAAMIRRVIADYFAIDVRLEQFVERWYRIPPQQRTRLGQNNAVLGGGALSGEYVLQCDLCIRLWLGPLDRDAFNAFLPGGDYAHALEKMLHLLTGTRLEYEIRLVLAPEAVSSARLGAADSAARLGWDAFLVTQQQTDVRTEAGYVLQ